ncbi:Core-2/I-Branching enzyme, partial [Dictyocaulus viviparus]
MMIYNTTIVQKLILDAADRCVAIRSLFGFDNKPVSQEEINYPLAIYKNARMFHTLFMLSSFYRPQNEYCIAVSGSADPSFKILMNEVDQCFHNVRVLHRPEISWGSFEIINSTYACLQVLSNSTTPWKYFQYLSGVDIPLKTNLEMIKIFKQWNDTINVEITRFQKQRINGKSSPESRELLHFLQNTSIPDESFWATISGNVDKFPIPGGTHAERWLQYREQYRTNHYKELELFEKTKHRMRYYLSRFQEWQGSGCSGKLASGSCVFGVDDLTDLLKQPHLVAHKFYIDFESAAYFCGLKEIRSRESKPLQLDVTPYSKIPQ